MEVVADASTASPLAQLSPLLDPPSEKYEPISTPALALRQTCDVCQYDIRAFWAAKSTFRAERHQEREKARLAGGEDWIRTRGCFSPDDRALLADKVHISPVCGEQRFQTGESGRLHGAGSPVRNQKFISDRIHECDFALSLPPLRKLRLRFRALRGANLRQRRSSLTRPLKVQMYKCSVCTRP
jgi:hypothetical protein